MAEDRRTVGLLHPGAMGASLGAQLVASGTPVIWASEGRSDESRRRAESAGLVDAGSLDALVAESDVIMSVCPPAAAIEVATNVSSLGFGGIYVDANAVSPATARSIDEVVAGGGLVDGGIIGPPVRGPGSTRLYLSGPEGDVATTAELFTETELDVRIVDGPVGAASAVKMCFAAWTKGTTALLVDICALAEAEGVTADLRSEWATSMPDVAARADRSPGVVGPKAWRFEGEMNEIAAAFDAHALPDGFHLAAAEVYRRLAGLKDVPDVSLDDVVDLVRARA